MRRNQIMTCLQDIANYLVSVNIETLNPNELALLSEIEKTLLTLKTKVNNYHLPENVMTRELNAYTDALANETRPIVRVAISKCITDLEQQLAKTKTTVKMGVASCDFFGPAFDIQTGLSAANWSRAHPGQFAYDPREHWIYFSLVIGKKQIFTRFCIPDDYLPTGGKFVSTSYGGDNDAFFDKNVARRNVKFGKITDIVRMDTTQNTGMFHTTMENFSDSLEIYSESDNHYGGYDKEYIKNFALTTLFMWCLGH